MANMHSFEVFCAKYTVFTVYILATFAGLLSLVTGLVYFFIFNHHVYFTVQQLWSFSFLLIMIGIVVSIIAFMGSMGAISKSPCLLLIPTILSTLILILQCGIGIYGAVKPDHSELVWNGIFNNTFKNYDGNKEVWDFMQRELHCCGIERSNDWTDAGRKIPNSCCPEPNGDSQCSTSNAFISGCKQELSIFLKSKTTIIISILFGIVVIQILTIVWSCFLYGVFRKENHYYRLNSFL